MKKLVWIILTIVVLIVAGWWGGTSLWRYVSSSEQAAFLYRKECVFEGLEQLEPSELRLLLPLNRSIFWWWFHLSELEQKLLEQPLIHAAEVERCYWYSWGCFRMSVVERRPEFVAVGEQQAWIVGSGGGFLAVVGDGSAEQANRVVRLVNRAKDLSIPVVYGIMVGEASPELTEVRLDYIEKALNIISGETQREVESLTLLADGELSARFYGWMFPVVFNIDRSDFNQMHTETRRLMALVDELGERLTQVEKIDLAYNQLAVVTFLGAEVDQGAVNK